jgi:hypothetical protein
MNKLIVRLPQVDDREVVKSSGLPQRIRFRFAT